MIVARPSPVTKPNLSSLMEATLEAPALIIFCDLETSLGLLSFGQPQRCVLQTPDPDLASPTSRGHSEEVTWRRHYPYLQSQSLTVMSQPPEASKWPRLCDPGDLTTAWHSSHPMHEAQRCPHPAPRVCLHCPGDREHQPTPRALNCLQDIAGHWEVTVQSWLAITGLLRLSCALHTM